MHAAVLNNALIASNALFKKESSVDGGSGSHGKANDELGRANGGRKHVTKKASVSDIDPRLVLERCNGKQGLVALLTSAKM